MELWSRAAKCGLNFKVLIRAIRRLLSFIMKTTDSIKKGKWEAHEMVFRFLFIENLIEANS